MRSECQAVDGSEMRSNIRLVVMNGFGWQAMQTPLALLRIR